MNTITFPRCRAAIVTAILTGVAAPLAAQQAGVDVSRYLHEITLPDTGKLIRNVTTIEFERDRDVTALRLDLLAPMKVTRATTGCTAATTAKFKHDGKVLEIPLPAGSGNTCVKVTYSGSPADGLVITTDTAGRWRAFGDNWPNRARHWLATIDHPSDKALVEFRVDAPTRLTVVANGTRKSAEPVKAPAPQKAVRTAKGAKARPVPAALERTLSTWSSAKPIPTYLMVIAAAPLSEYSLGETACGLGGLARCVQQSVYTAPEQAKFMPGNFKFADDIVRFFSRTVAPFPYERLAHLQSSTRFGGMENAGAIFYADRLFRRQDGVGIGLIAHETAHQWFGDAVTEKEWGHLWLSEGFATYFAALYTEYAQGTDPFRTEMARIRATVTGNPVVAERPVLDTAQTDLMALLNANSYQKGGFVLHMLRSEIGDSAFFRGVRRYWTAHKDGNAMTDDLRTAVEAESQRELKWFFDQWLTRPGFADVTTSWAHDTATGEVALNIAQGTRFAPYRFTLRVAVESAEGQVTEYRVDVQAEASTRVVLAGKFTAPPKAVRVDPRTELLAVFHEGARTP